MKIYTLRILLTYIQSQLSPGKIANPVDRKYQQHEQYQQRIEGGDKYVDAMEDQFQSTTDLVIKNAAASVEEQVDTPTSGSVIPIKTTIQLMNPLVYPG